MSRKFKLPSWSDTLLTVFAAMLCGLGSGFANHASLGMDGIGIFYDGIRNILGLSSEQIGTASYVVSFALFVFLWFAGRKYVSFGSVIYVLVYGICANLGTTLAQALITIDQVYVRAIEATCGFLTLYFGLGIFIAVDIGVDAFTGVVLWLCDVTHKKMDIIKIIFDLSLTLIGFLLGGKLGVLTVISVIAAGPCIAFFTKVVQKAYFKFKLSKLSK